MDTFNESVTKSSAGYSESIEVPPGKYAVQVSASAWGSTVNVEVGDGTNFSSGWYMSKGTHLIAANTTLLLPGGSHYRLNVTNYGGSPITLNIRRAC